MLYIGFVCVTRPLKDPKEEGANGTLLGGPCRLGLAQVGQEDDTCVNLADMETFPHSQRPSGPWLTSPCTRWQADPVQPVDGATPLC
jgi:hypothetical protein